MVPMTTTRTAKAPTPKQVSFIEDLEAELVSLGTPVPARPEPLVGGYGGSASIHIDVLKYAINLAKSTARKAEARKTEASFEGVQVWEGVIDRFFHNDYGSEQVQIRTEHGLAVATFPRKLDDTYRTVIDLVRQNGGEVRVRVAGTVRVGSGKVTRFYFKKAAKHALVELVDDLPTNEAFHNAKHTWKSLCSTWVTAERTVSCCGHEHHYGSFCGATIQVMSDVWESCGCTAPVHERSTTVPAEKLVVAPTPEPTALVAWFEALTPAEQALAEVNVSHAAPWTSTWAMVRDPEQEARYLAQINYVG